MSTTTINREEFLAEQIIREHVRKRIKKNLYEKTLVENKIRKYIRTLLETETGTEEPSTYTGINVLADILEKIIPVLEDDYKMLTTSKEQRDSFRNHIIHAVKNSLRPIESATDAEDVSEEIVYSLDRNLLEKIQIDLNADDDTGDSETISGEFIDIDGELAGDTSDFVQIDDQNETGRNFAATSFKKVEKQIVDAYDMLADEEDQKLYYDYLVTNLLLYFDKFEDELQPNLPDTTTPEYEKEKDEEENEDTPSDTPEDDASPADDDEAGDEDLGDPFAGL
tara:strand:- start:364 stop:1206 length:843 start_codon:yes stop_codon:yes gene_type:complete